MPFAKGALDFSKNIRKHAYYVSVIELILPVVDIFASYFLDDLKVSTIALIFGLLLIALFACLYWIGRRKRNSRCLVAFLVFKILLIISGLYHMFSYIISLNVMDSIGTLFVLVAVVYECLVVIQLIQSIRNGYLAQLESRDLI